MTDLEWSLEGVVDRLRADAPVIANGLFPTQAPSGDPRRVWAARALRHVALVCQSDPVRLAAAVEAFAITSFDFLRLQARFAKTGQYACTSADELDALYTDPEQMVEYLDGLALSYAMWTNHVEMIRFYAETFLPDLPEDATVVEIGPGHGLFATILLETRPGARYLGVDISASSLGYTRAALESTGADMSRVRLEQADATSPSFSADVGLDRLGGLDAVICCEVLEHVDEPEVIVDRIAALLPTHGRAFVSTVANLEAVDHVYLFDDVDHIRGVLAGAGLVPVREQPLGLPGSEDVRPLPLNYSAIVST